VTVVQQAFEKESKQIGATASAELNIPQARVQKILEVKLQEHVYMIQVVQILQEESFHARLDLCQQMRFKIT
jgi:hypothetical protein